jgi:oxygen-independent coproporphyrinogen III oxidase
MSTTGNLGLYVHIPFCNKKCPYCHFYVVPKKTAHITLLDQALAREWELKKGQLQKKNIDTIYFGGGTPALCPESVALFLEKVHKGSHVSPTPEITIEANPEEITEGTLAFFKKIGINRISLGAQSFDENALLTIGRNHTPSKTLKAIDLCAHYFDNISIDLMFDLPNETTSSIQKSAEKLPSLPVSHISLYNLTIERQTLFYKKRDTLNLPSPQKSSHHLDYLISAITAAGFTRYEISAFCKQGKIARHNSKYWQNQEVMGFGPSATSYFGGRRFKNVANLLQYAKLLETNKSYTEYEEVLDLEASYRLSICLYLRLLRGMPLELLQSSPYFSKIENELSLLIQERLLIMDEGSLRLTPKGLLLHDSICEKLI